MSYAEFIAAKKHSIGNSGFLANYVPDMAFDFQRHILTNAVKKGRQGVFLDTGLGKTLIQLSIANNVVQTFNKRVLILTPLAVAFQFINEAQKIGIDDIEQSKDGTFNKKIVLANYERLHLFDPDDFLCVMLDESSILKNFNGATRDAIVAFMKRAKYRYLSTATPSPNDFIELGNSSEALGYMGYMDMLTKFFKSNQNSVDSNNRNIGEKFYLKPHAEKDFFAWVNQWAVMVKKPSDIGFDDSRFVLPELKTNNHTVVNREMFSIGGQSSLFVMPAKTMTEVRQEQKHTTLERCERSCELAIGKTSVYWCNTNDESAELARIDKNAVEILGSMSIDKKEDILINFANGSIDRLITKASMTSMGLNWQHCNHTVYFPTWSYEQYYQAIRRFWRFGQKREVHCHVISAQSEGAVVENIRRKELQNKTMSTEMVNHMSEYVKSELFGIAPQKSEYERRVVEGDGYTLHNADCIDLAREIESDSVGFTIYSPPFSSLFTYSNSDRDMGNSKSEGEFYEHFSYLIDEMYRITMPGRLMAVHCMQLTTSKTNDGFIGIRDFRGDLIRMFQAKNWIYHSEVCIWKDPVVAMQRTKALGLLHKTIKKDSSMSRQGLADYLIVFRKPGLNVVPISHTAEEFPVQLWQRYASPVWFDINQTRTLNYREARHEDDVKHICPLQLDVIERALDLWSAPDDLVFSPFLGVGSEGYCAVKAGRRFIGSELKPSYFDQAVKNLQDAKRETMDLFS